MATNVPKARLKINGVIHEIKSFTLTAPPRALGYALTCQLVNPTVALSVTDEITFELGNRRAGVESMKTYIDSGRVAGRKARLSFKGDTLTFDAVNPLANKWARAPRKPELLFDPDRVEIEGDRARTNNDVIDERGDPIESRLVEVRGLDLKYILHRAYVEVMGFTRVVSNVPNYRVRQAEFPITQSYHQAAQSFAAFFEPEFFADDQGQMFLIDPQRKLPAGFAAAAKVISNGKVIALSFDQPAAQEINAILLTYMVDDNNSSGISHEVDFPPNVTDNEESEFVETGVLGTDGYSIQITTRRWKEFHDDDRNPQRVTREVDYQVITDNYAWDSQAGAVVLISTEITTELYSRDYRLHLGHNRSIQALVRIPDGGDAPIFIEALTEIARTKWKASMMNRDEFVKLYSYTLTDGFVVIEGDESNPASVITKMPLLDANRTRNVSRDGIQRLVFRPISTIYERHRATGTNQTTVTLTKIDHLTPSLESSKSVSHIADQTVNLASPNANTGSRKTVTELIIGEDVELDPLTGEELAPFVPLALNAGEVPIALAVEVAKRKLKRQGQPLATASCELANFDVNMRRGSIRRIDRRGVEGDLFIVTGFRITGSNLGTGEGRITQSFDAIIVQSE